MSIVTGKDGYSSVEEFRARTLEEFRHKGGVIWMRDTEPPEHERAFVRTQLAGASSVLELGCGLGPWARLAQEVGVQYAGVDPVRERIAYCREHWQGAFVLGDATTIRLSVTFDVVLSVTVLQHLTLPDACDLLRTAAAHLVAGGKLVMIESRIMDATQQECERLYGSSTCPLHMLPKPKAVLEDAAPFDWQCGDREDRYVLVRR